MAQFDVITLWRVVGLLLAVMGLLACSGDQQPPEPRAKLVKTEVITAKDEFLHFSLSGRAKAAREVNLAFEVPGRIDFLPLHVGDDVTRRQTIARLNQDSYRARFEAAKAQHTLAKSEAQRMTQLMSRKTISQTQLDQAMAQLDVAASHLALSQKALQDTTLKAPFAGTLVAIYVDNHSYIRASEHIARLIDTSQLEFVVDIPELWIKRHKRNVIVTANIEFDAYPEQYIKATLKELSLEASSKTGTFAATFILDQPKDTPIYPGMAGQLVANVKRHDIDMEAVISVPLAAIFTPPQLTQSHVWLVKEGRLYKQPVTLGHVVGERVEITEGLALGDEVVIAGVHFLTVSQTVKSL